MGKVFEHILTGTGRRQQDGITFASDLGRRLYSALQRISMGDAHPLTDYLRQLIRVATDQHQMFDAIFDGRQKRSKISTFGQTARDQHDLATNALLDTLERRHRRANIGPFGIIDIMDAAQTAKQLAAMWQASELAQCRSHSRNL